jgi:hypothetical protein
MTISNYEQATIDCVSQEKIYSHFSLVFKRMSPPAGNAPIFETIRTASFFHVAAARIE